MKAVFEIVAAVLAVFGGYTILDMIRTRLLYPKSIRQDLRAAVIFNDTEALCKTAAYARLLRREQKISSERLIILVNDDIIKADESISLYGEVYIYNKR